ncbi:hypothetical protein CVD28_01590 [Bacillus sp. M6-12]|uniref:hypothetical protein n=1 Tax=Bacillus sp. M6-12 TaxID=2054166 RepID=UPI000C786BD8|nr:hypothetical protein [Bacillus sp. M6-12]PLS19126.1 hypothetical protein CVD28_01590 [Bacillus sp. M6-12]
MRKEKQLKRKLIPLISLLSIGTVTMTATISSYGVNSQTTKLIGTFEATILDVKVPAMTTFIYNPNTESMTSEEIDVHSETNAPIYMKMNSIGVAEESDWKPSLVSPTLYSDEGWRNLTQAKTAEKVALGVAGLPSDQWLYELNDGIVWSVDKEEERKVGTIKNHGSIKAKPTLKAGTSVPTEDLLTANYVFEFGLEEGKKEIPKELANVQESGKNILMVDTQGIQGTTVTQTKATDMFTKAIELAKPGDGIYLQNGTYNIQSNDVFWTSPNKKYSNMVLRKSLTIIGEDPSQTTLVIDDTNSKYFSDGQHFAITFNAPNITLKNMTIKVKQENIKSLWSIFNVWGRWDGSTARNTTIENVRIEVDSAVPYLFYMNDYDLNIKNVTVVGKGNIKNMFYWNYGSAHFYDSKFDMPRSNGYGSGSVTTSNTQFNLPTSSLQ